MQNDVEIVVVGAGAAGLNAACELQAAGRRVCVVEARARTGGRVATVAGVGYAMELGAEFVHGKDPLLWALLKEAGLETQEVDGSMLCFTEKGIGKCAAAHGAAFDIVEKIDPKLSPDVSFSEYLKRSKASAGEREAVTGFVEGFNAADATRISARSLAVQQRAEDAISGDRSWRVVGGYAQLISHLERKFLNAGGRIELKTAVEEVDWMRGDCTVRARREAEQITLRCARVLVTVPLGVLQRRAIRFTPEPEELAAADRMAMGTAHRFVIRFKTAFWKESSEPSKKELAQLSFLFADAQLTGPFRVWWTAHPDDSPVLTAWCGGSRAEAMNARLRSEHGADALFGEAIAQLARVFQRDEGWLRTQVEEWHFHNWAEDEFAYGSYSYVLAGELEAPFAMAAPVEETLFFAGEHTDLQGHWGTVHAALASGYRAARQILEPSGLD